MQLNKDKLITEKQKKEGLNTDSIPIHSPNPLPLDEDEAAAPPPERTGSRKEAAYQIYRDLILENIEYDTLTQNPRIDREQLDEIVDILLETVCTNRKSIRVAGDDYPAELVKAKFLKLDSHHIEFVMDCLRDNTTKVRNIKQYLGPCFLTRPAPSTATMRPLWRTIWRSLIGAARPTTDRKERPPMRTLYLRRLVVPP